MTPQEIVPLDDLLVKVMEELHRLDGTRFGHYEQFKNGHLNEAATFCHLIKGCAHRWLKNEDDGPANARVHETINNVWKEAQGKVSHDAAGDRC